MFYKFIGKDGSMGFINGEIYYLEKFKKEYKFDFGYELIIVSQGRQIPYSSEKTFQKNWLKVEV